MIECKVRVTVIPFSFSMNLDGVFIKLFIINAIFNVKHRLKKENCVMLYNISLIC